MATSRINIDRVNTLFGINANQLGSRPLNLEIGATLCLDGGFLFSADYRSIIDREPSGICCGWA